MASSGSEEVVRRPSQLTAAAPASPTLVTSSRAGSCSLQRRGLHTLEPSVAQGNVKVGQNQLLCVSGTTHGAFVHTNAGYPTVAKFDDIWSAGNSGSKKTVNGRIGSDVTDKSCHCISLVSFPSPYQLEPAIHCYQPHRHLNSNRFSSGLLGKRAFSLQPAVHPICPPPPKAASHKSTAPLRSIMPTNPASPWGTSKFQENSNGYLRPSLPQVPVLPRLSDLEKHSANTFPSTSHTYGMEEECREPDARLACTTVPLQSKFQDLVKNGLCGVRDRSQELKTVAEGLSGCPNVRHGVKVFRSARKASTQMDFTAAVRKLAESGMKLRYATVRDLYGAPTSLSATRFTMQSAYQDAADSTPVKPTALGLSQLDHEPGLALAVASSRSSLNSYSNSTVCFSSASCGEVTEGGASPEEAVDELTQSSSVYSVATQISAIHLTQQNAGLPLLEDHSSSLPPLEGQNVMTCSVLDQEHKDLSGVHGDEEELPDGLENDCGRDDYDGSDCSSMNDASSTASMVILSNVEEAGVSDQEDSRVEVPALVPSLFPFMAPTLYFSTANERVELLPPEQRKLLRWKMSSVTPNIVKQTVARSHFRATKKSHDWLGCWGHHMKSPGFKAIREYQKLNHFPGSFQIGRKDRLWRNLSKMQVRFGKQEFGFFPRSFVLPQDMKLLRKAWEEGGSRQKWIIKPPASARGIGIQVIHKWSQMPRRRPLLVQKYIHKPYLITGNKFDLRVYVYVSSYDPLRIYIFSDGLVRFASCKYSSSTKNLGNKFMHLTNYSVNKKNSEYQSNSDDKACQGHKWALKALWQYLGSKGINTTRIWERIKDIVIKTIIVSDPYVNTLVKMHVRSPYSCHELFGFDIMLDENLKPWVLEVNISPSLHSSSPLDVTVKGQMIRDVLNLAGFVLPHHEDVLSAGSGSSSSLCGGMKDRVGHVPELSSDEKVKRAYFLSHHSADQEFYSAVLDILTPEDVRTLAETEDELSRCGEFERVFPSSTSSRYLRFFEHPRYLNILLNQWEQKYSQNRAKGISLLKSLCQAGVHLGRTSNPSHIWSCRVVSGQKSESYSNLSPLQEHIRPRMAAQMEEDDFVATSSPHSVRFGSCGSSPCSSLASESLNPKELI